ncbi:unnamed protein product [Ascophyllum nodosum]
MASWRQRRQIQHLGAQALALGAGLRRGLHGRVNKIRALSAAGMWVLLLGVTSRVAPVHSQLFERGLVEPEEACLDFNSGRRYPGSSWTPKDCMDVWARFVQSVPEDLHLRPPSFDTLRDTTDKLQQAGSSCLVASIPAAAGVGTSMLRHLSAWIFAEEIGCDWATPDWGRRLDPGDDKAVLYCHKVATTEEIGQAMLRGKADEIRRCSLINWMEFFQLDVPSVRRPRQGTFRVIESSLNETDALVDLRQKVQYSRDKALQLPWDHVLFTSDATFAGQQLLTIGSWDETRRAIVRTVLQEARFNFHRHPRRWYDEGTSSCTFDHQSLNFAVHVRMGDRREFQDGSTQYLKFLERFMISVSSAVIAKGMMQPTFHVFSETLAPCPSEDTRLFDEFPAWSIEADEITRCWEAKTPQDCPEKRVGAKLCNPVRSGVFFVEEKPIILHVGHDVGNAMSCMIQSDGVMMGCSAFGQVAGLLTEGIRFFSTQCDGTNTPDQLKAMPPLAIAERGYLWVPISGSWRDPVLVSTEILDGALDTLLEYKYTGTNK